uniref:Ovule protein n=1 Tax=Heterorhabditis bacteriophora TaxID=37862 RepID=A0A1I7XAH2_HETBA
MLENEHERLFSISHFYGTHTSSSKRCYSLMHYMTAIGIRIAVASPSLFNSAKNLT